MRDHFLAFLCLKSLLSLFCLLIYELSSLIKWFIPSDLSFYLIFLCFLMFLSSTCYDVCLFIGFCVDDSDGKTVSIR